LLERQRVANSIPKKRAKAEQLRKKRAQAASALATGAKKSLKAIPAPTRPRQPSSAARVG
jgi:hypothetical protein